MSELKNMVTIPVVRYLSLLKSERVLEALHAGGVDNWDWYGEALRGVEEQLEVEDLLNGEIK